MAFFTLQGLVKDTTGNTVTSSVVVTVNQPTTAPGTVTDLTVTSTAANSLTVAFTEVDDGTGAPAKYDLRYAVGTLSWGAALSTSTGITGTTIGAKHTFTIPNLLTATAYQVMLVSYRGTLNLNAVFGGLSNVANGTTGSVIAPPPPSGGTVLFTESFDDPAFQSNFFAHGWYDTAAPVDSTVAHGTGQSIKSHWPVGANNPDNWGGGMRQKFTPTDRVFVRYWIKYSDSWTWWNNGGGASQHELYLLTNASGDFSGLAATPLTCYLESRLIPGTADATICVSMQDGNNIVTSPTITVINGKNTNNVWPGVEAAAMCGCNGDPGDGLQFLDCYPGGGWHNGKAYYPTTAQYSGNPSSPNYKGNWNKVEAYLQLNSVVNGIGQGDGIIRIWFNGSLVYERTAVRYRTGAHPNMLFNQFIIGPYVSGGAQADQSMWLDDITVATGSVP